jgi:hypothetical protein
MPLITTPAGRVNIDDAHGKVLIAVDRYAGSNRRMLSAIVIESFEARVVAKWLLDFADAADLRRAVEAAAIS